MTTRDEIAVGPKFLAMVVEAREYPLPPAECRACNSLVSVWSTGCDLDADTGLCRPCWRAWRFRPSVAEQLIAASPGLGSTEFRRRNDTRTGGIAYSFSDTLLDVAGGLLGLLRDWEMLTIPELRKPCGCEQLYPEGPWTLCREHSDEMRPLTDEGI